MAKSFYRQKLPHIQTLGATYFITYRLHNSIPQHIIEQLKFDNDLLLKRFGISLTENEKSDQTSSKKYFKSFDDFLDSNPNGPYWLGQEEIARTVHDSLLHLNRTSIDLFASTIMSNHVHALLSLKKPEDDLYKILQSHKSFTAKKANDILKRSGKFWSTETYDHIVRDGEFDNIVSYILQNPVKARLVNKWEDWKWSYLVS